MVSPPLRPGEVDVWLWEWQVAEDRRQVLLGETVMWDLVPMDQDWISKLFADRRSVPLQLDTYAGHSEPADAPEWTRMSGVVQRIEHVSVRYVQPTDPSGTGSVPERGAAVVHTVPSIWPEQPHTGSTTGWIVRIVEAFS
ncbi:hypothetical protein EAX62_01670 [Tessaracoccus antarcticus]|uniref:Uncharacterized protein n=1 Tax=Tessaracoccus antarcticus TaxID=2479848 RepID=A0A3M0GFD9_9ACTN|nr:hypothetical protein EAX62_01670 [Tessaracoccus antarcticus]